MHTYAGSTVGFKKQVAVMKEIHAGVASAPAIMREEPGQRAVLPNFVVDFSGAASDTDSEGIGGGRGSVVVDSGVVCELDRDLNILGVDIIAGAVGSPGVIVDVVSVGERATTDLLDVRLNNVPVLHLELWEWVSGRPGGELVKAWQRESVHLHQRASGRAQPCCHRPSSACQSDLCERSAHP